MSPIAHKKIKRKTMKTGKYVKGFYFLNERKMVGTNVLLMCSWPNWEMIAADSLHGTVRKTVISFPNLRYSTIPSFLTVHVYSMMYILLHKPVP